MLQARLNHLYGFIQRLGDGPIAIAYSGGGDSMALLHMLRDYPTITHAFIIDHALRDGSAEEVSRAADFARSLGYQVVTNRWDHGGITSAIQVKAREYRYQAMGEMCRDLGIAHLLTAHTADDQAETLLMRKARDTGWRGLAGMEMSAYAPLWPALAGVNLHRPLLKISRQELRDYNHREALSWIEDPSNENQDFARVRARSDLAIKPALQDKLLELQAQNATRLMAERKLLGTWLERYAEIDPRGFVTATRVPPAELLLHLLRAVSGTGGPIDAARREALCQAMADNDFTAATLAGAWVVKQDEGYLYTRDISSVKPRAGEVAPLGAPILLPKDKPYLWDGRFWLMAKEDDIYVIPAFGQIEALGKNKLTQQILDYAPQIRPTLPVYRKGEAVIGFGAIDSDLIKAHACHETRLKARFLP